jgi:hypothetical protein
MLRNLKAKTRKAKKLVRIEETIEGTGGGRSVKKQQGPHNTVHAVIKTGQTLIMACPCLYAMPRNTHQ